MHLALLLKFPNGLYQILYLVVLTEFCDNTNVATSYYLRGPKIFSHIDPKRTYASSAASISRKSSAGKWRRYSSSWLA